MKMLRKMKYFFENFNFLRVYNSPFRAPKPRLYIGKVAIGTPYFFPRRWVKYTDDDALKATIKSMNDPEMITQSFDTWYDSYKRYRKAVPKKIGLDFVSLGWKTKWSDTDYRFEWAPLLSFVFFGYQIAVMVIAPQQHHYWEAWLYYEKNTDKTKPASERIQICRNEFPLIYDVSDMAGKRKVDYYNTILKNKQD